MNPDSPRHFRLFVLAALAITACALLTVSPATAALASESGGSDEFSDTRGEEWVAPTALPLTVLRPFDPPTQPWLAGHRGVDLAATPGESVRAAGAGIVEFAGSIAGRGVVTVSHGDLRTTYEPVKPSLQAGASVQAGEPIGIVGTGGHCQRSCLHWGLIRGSTYLNPLSLLNMIPPVLKTLSAFQSSAQSSAQVSAPAARRGAPPGDTPETQQSGAHTNPATATGAALAIVIGAAAAAAIRRKSSP